MQRDFSQGTKFLKGQVNKHSDITNSSPTHLEALCGVFQFHGHHVERVVHPGGHLVRLSEDGRTHAARRYAQDLLLGETQGNRLGMVDVGVLKQYIVII